MLLYFVIEIEIDIDIEIDIVFLKLTLYLKPLKVLCQFLYFL